MDVLRCDDDFVRPHSPLGFGEVTRTPAMQAGNCDRASSFRGISSQALPPLPKPCTLDYDHAVTGPRAT